MRAVTRIMFSIPSGDSTVERASKRQRLAPFLIEPSSSSSTSTGSKAAAVAGSDAAAELPEVIVAAKKRNILVSALHIVYTFPSVALLGALADTPF